jgi:putative aminopeptidase FrvX
MSYSFSVTGTNKAEVMKNIADALDGVVKQQTIHTADREQAERAIDAFIDVLGEPGEGEQLGVSVNGYVSATDGVIRSATISISASLIAASKEA